MKDVTYSMKLTKPLSQNNPSSINSNPNAGLGLFDISKGNSYRYRQPLFYTYLSLHLK